MVTLRQHVYTQAMLACRTAFRVYTALAVVVVVERYWMMLFHATTEHYQIYSRRLE